MSPRISPALGSLIFFVLAPGTVAGYVPYVISKWRIGPALLQVPLFRALGIVLIVAGLFALISCFIRFALEGRGTPAPVAPTENLVLTGMYRYVRNPMYVAVVSIIAGQALLFGITSLLGYASAAWLLMHLFVVIYEEPTLRRQYADSYVRYVENVHRWWPRATPWRGDA